MDASPPKAKQKPACEKSSSLSSRVAKLYEQASLGAEPPKRNARIRRPIRLHTTCVEAPLEEWLIFYSRERSGDRVPVHRKNNYTGDTQLPLETQRHTETGVWLRTIWPDGEVTLGRGVDVEAVRIRTAQHLNRLRQTAGELRQMPLSAGRAVDLTLPPETHEFNGTAPPNWTSPDDGWTYRYEINEWDEREPVSRIRNGMEQIPTMIYHDEAGRMTGVDWPDYPNESNDPVTVALEERTRVDELGRPVSPRPGDMWRHPISEETFTWSGRDWRSMTGGVAHVAEIDISPEELAAIGSSHSHSLQYPEGPQPWVHAQFGQAGTVTGRTNINDGPGVTNVERETVRKADPYGPSGERFFSFGEPTAQGLALIAACIMGLLALARLMN